MTSAVDLAPAFLSCTGKEQYRSANLAAKVAKRRNHNKKIRLKASQRPLAHYHCRHCGFWHIGGGRGPKREDRAKQVSSEA